MVTETKRSRRSTSKKTGTKSKKPKKRTTGSSTSKRKHNRKNVSVNNKTRKSTNSRSTAKTRRNRRQDVAKEKQGINMGIELQLVISFFLMLLFMLSNFGICGEVGNIMSGVFFGLFGCVQYVMPVAAFLAVAVLLVNDYSTLSMKKCFAGFVFLMMISGFVHIFTQPKGLEINQIFGISLQNRLSGGVIGGGLACLLTRWFGLVGAFLIMFCVFVLSMIMLTQRSMVGFFRKKVEQIQISMDERKEERANRPAKEPKRRKTHEDRERERQCEDKVKELEEQRMEAQIESSKKAVQTNKTKEQPEIEKNVGESAVPTFQPSDEVKRKDSVKELHPEIYPFTPEDGKTTPFEQNLDYSAFSFNSGKSSDEYEEERQEQIKSGEELKRRVDEMAQTMASQGVREIAVNNQADEIVLDAISEEEVPSEENEPVNNSPIIDLVEPEEEVVPSKEATAKTKKAEAPNREAVNLQKGAENVVIHKEREEAKKGSLPNDKKTSFTTKKAEGADYIFPPMTLLKSGGKKNGVNYDDMLKSTAMKLQETLQSFGVNVRITDISLGPAVTRYEMVPEQGTKVSKIVSLTDDIRLNLAAADIRIEAPIPGKSAIGIEVPNKDTMMVHFRDLIENDRFRTFKSKLAFAVGKDIGGQVVISDIAKMPHLLIAGATGSGKSVCINTLIMSILYKARPDEVRLIMIDPKMVELSIYNGIPHLLSPVVTDPKKASGALNWGVAEMTNRYAKFAEVNVRNIEGYNEKLKQLVENGLIEEEKAKPMPQIVIIIDELADLMMVAPGEVEDAIVRLSQLARAAGIHLVIATQRPSVNVITGLIKANVPSRIAFAVSSGVDSRTIIDMNGAEKLLGKGDMLFYPSGSSKPSRVQGAFISDDEIFSVVEFLKENETVEESKEPEETTMNFESFAKGSAAKGGDQERDEYFEDAARFLLEKEKASIGMLQRAFKIGFNRAARIMDQLADAGIVGPEEGTKPRKILMGPEQLEQYFEEYL